VPPAGIRRFLSFQDEKWDICNKMTKTKSSLSDAGTKTDSARHGYQQLASRIQGLRNASDANDQGLKVLKAKAIHAKMLQIEQNLQEVVDLLQAARDQAALAKAQTSKCVKRSKGMTKAYYLH